MTHGHQREVDEAVTTNGCRNENESEAETFRQRTDRPRSVLWLNLQFTLQFASQAAQYSLGSRMVVIDLSHSVMIQNFVPSSA